MINRRNIRVKVMQTLYSLESGSGNANEAPQAILARKMQESRYLFSYLLYFISEVALFSETDARRKASKHLPSQTDLAVNTKIAHNELLLKFLGDPSFQSVLKDAKFTSLIDPDLLRKIYTELTGTAEYKEYIADPSRNKREERHILEFIFNSLMLPNELFISHMEEQFMNWDDDAEMMQTLVMNYLSKPVAGVFADMLGNDKWDFARKLLETVLSKKEYTLELIKPKLKNWDADRIAALDMILLQMGVCEFLYFETIPTKVTINEYIDLAKAYSTVQSGQFINGILDNIHKELMAENKIEKVNFKNPTT